MSDDTLLDIRNATLWRGRTRVFDRFSLRIGRHERVAIIGPNGAGKTTLLMAINREIYPVADPAATFRLFGRDRWNVWDLRTQLGMVSHDLQQRYRPSTLALDVVLSGYFASVGVHGSLSSRVSADERRQAHAALERAGLAGVAATPLGQLSTGQQRRCLLARALVHDPGTLILDEPTTGLDLKAQFDYHRSLAALARDGRGIVLVTHHTGDIPPEIDRVVLLDRGRVVADDHKDRVLESGTLSRVYGVPLQVVRAGGYCFVFPEPGHDPET